MILYILNLADLITTAMGSWMGLSELNPLVGGLIATAPALYVVIKISIFPLCLWLRHKKSYLLAVGAYGATVVWNIMNLAMMA